MTAIAYTANPGAPHYVAPTMRLFRAPPGGGDEVPLDDWKPTSLHWRCNGEISTLDIECVLGRGDGKARVRPESVVMNAGDRIRLLDTATDEEWFRGHASHQSLMIQSGKDIESVRWVVLGPERLLAQKVVEGQWCKTETADDWNIAGNLSHAAATRDTVFQTAHPCIFNEHGRSNANQTTHNLNPLRWKLDSVGAHYAPDDIGNECLVFEPEGRGVRNDEGNVVIGTQRWTTYTALQSIVEWIDRYEVVDYFATNWAHIRNVLSILRASPARLPETNVQGKTLLEAIAAILLPQGFGFCLEPWAVHAFTDQHRLIVFPLSVPITAKTPNLAALVAGANVGVTSPAGQRAVVQRLNFARDSGNVANEIIIQGDYKRVQVALEFGGGEAAANWDIKPFWNTTTHAISNWYVDGKFPNQLGAGAPTVGGDSFFDRHHPDGCKHAQYRHVYRTFTWNEDGPARGYGWAIPTMGPYGLNDPTTALSARIRASVWMAIVDENGTIDANTWMNMTPTIWPDRCAFTLCAPCQMTDKNIVPWFPWKGGGTAGTGSGSTYENVSFLTLLHNTITVASGKPKLVLRFVGTVASDGVVRGLGRSVAGAGAASRWPLTARRILNRRNRYYLKAVLDTHTWTTNVTDIEDDSTEIQADADLFAAVAGTEMGHGSIILRHLSRQYELGDGIPATAGRAIDFSLDSGGDRYPIVVGVTWTFTENANKTELVLDSPMLGIT